MISFLKRLKALYIVYNFFHRKQLKHNVPAFRKLGIKKNYYSPISSKDFTQLDNMPQTNAAALNEKLSSSRFFATLSAPSKESILSFTENGYAILYNYLSPAQVDSINAEVDALLKNKTVTMTRNRVMFAIHYSQLLSKIAKDKQLEELLAILLDGEPVLFQSMNFIMGSEQATHSDSIHMTTYPLGGLLGVWIALDDITEENGPLHYYPKSHLLPYYMNEEYGNEGNYFMIGNRTYDEYGDMIQSKIKEKKLEKKTFLAKKGDMIIWHANLFHGGNEHHNKQQTRKSVVFHYFKKGSICYHEISQRPALFKPF